MLLNPLLDELHSEFGNISQLPNEMQPIYFIMNCLPRSEVGLSLNKWRKTWSMIVRVLHEIDRLSHPDEELGENEPDPEDALDFISSQRAQTQHN